MRPTALVSSWVILAFVSTAGMLGCTCAARAQESGTSRWICPEEISVEQRLTAPLEGWETGRSKGRAALELVTIYDGHPRELASLVPDGQERRRAGRTAAFWKLNPSKAYWVECAYRRTDVVIFRRLSEKTSRCEVVTDGRRLVNGREPIVDVRCR